MVRALSHVVGILALGAISAGAQSLPPNAPAHQLLVDATALRPGRFVYQTTLEGAVATSVIGTRTVTVSATTYAGAPAWLLLETRTGAVDSLLTDMANLHPVHWSSTLGEARVAAEFRGETMYAGLSSPAGRRSMMSAVPSSSLVSAAMLETVLRLVPLRMAWEDSATTLSVSLDGNTVLPTRLSVIGEDDVRVPAGQFDCWVVAVHADTARGLYWVTKRDPMVVRSALDVPLLGGAQLVNALTSVNP